ncbi:regulator of (H+)-ATPase in vacuolar membrane [Parahypoxylon ruwenzoriense]
MKVVLPGQPEASLQAVSTGYWKCKRVIVYITGDALTILSGPNTILQTIYDNDERKLEAVAFDEFSGKIAACTAATVRIYRPLSHGDDDSPKWALQTSVDIGEGSTPATLSWGGSEELLVGRSSLWLYDTKSTPVSCHWRQELASPAKAANLSYDSSYIASVGYHDRLVKVWRRLNFGSEEVHFDFCYLLHPRAVTSIQWRKPFYVDQTIENVLYTFCVDNFMRVWTGADGFGYQSLRQWGKLDLAAATRDEHETGKHKSRWAFIISQRDLASATERAVQERGDGQEKEDVALQYLLSIANRDTEICVVLDGHGSMSSWALENVSSKSKGTGNVDNVAYVKSKDFDFLGLSTREYHVEILSYCNKNTGNLHVLFHHFDGKVEVFETNIADFLDPTSGAKHRLVPRATWSGHSASVKKIVRNFSGHAIVSRTEKGESIVWRHATSPRTKLLRQNVIPEKRHIHRICLIRGGRFVVFLHHESISVWDCTSSTHKLLADCEYRIRGKPLCILVLPRERVEDDSVAHIATVTSEQQGVIWELHLPLHNGNATKTQANGHKKSLREFCTFKLDGAGDLAYVLPVDPAGSSLVISGFLDVFARDVAVSYTHSGRVEFWTAKVTHERNQVEWLSTSSMETGVSEPALASGGAMKKAALVNSNRSEVTIWDIRGARLEYKQDFESSNPVQDLDWTSTPDSQSILAVGFPYRVILLSQMRFDYLNKGPAWAPIREISTRDFTPHPIGDSTWLSDGHLVIGAGHQLFLYDRTFETTDRLISSARVPHRRDGTRDLFDVIQRLNGPLPIFHPQFLIQCILAGKHTVVRRILQALNHTLKYHVEGDVIDDYLGLDLTEFYLSNTVPMATNGDSSSYLVSRVSFDDNDEAFTEDVALTICENLQKFPIPQLSGHEQIQLLDIVEGSGVVEKERRSMDENGARFMLFFRQHALRKGRTNEIHMSWREINWAYHSTSQDILVDFVSRQYHNTMLWQDARESGMFMWLADEAAVKTQFEILARNEYTKSEAKNPVDCSLFYLALKKKTILQGLWRMASWNKEQGATQRLLANNFNDPKWKTTALKNAYALLSKRRFGTSLRGIRKRSANVHLEYAAAFFLLAGYLQDAVNVCLNQIKDLQLAIAITRVYEGDHGPILRKLLENEVLAIAAEEGNRWLASWAFWMLGRRDMAVRALIVSSRSRTRLRKRKTNSVKTPVYTLLETPASSDLKSKLFLTDDPTLIVLYSQLRQKTLQTLHGASKVTPRTEWEFVLHNARLYDRMGCDLLGLDLVRNWEFLRRAPSMALDLGGDIDPRKLLRRRGSVVVQDMPVSPVVLGDMKAGGHGIKPPPSVFEEPDANSLLDSFGF